MEGAVHPDIEVLRRIRCLSQFEQEQLEALTNKLELECAGKNQVLTERGCAEHYSLYLIDGSLTAISADGAKIRFDGSTNDELNPIAKLRPSLYEVITNEPAQFLKIYADQLTEFAQQQVPDQDLQFDVIEIEQSAEEQALTIQLFDELMSGNLALPSLPSVAQRIQKEFSDDSVDAESIGAIIQSDPVITAKIIMTANSALYRGTAQIDSLPQAVVRLGLETTRKQVMTHAVKELFNGISPGMQSHMQAIWAHSQHVASLCRLLAGQLKTFDPEQAQLAGLVHDLGVVAILNYAQDHEALCADPKLLLAAVDNLRPQITGMLLNLWNFGPEFITVGEESEDWFRNPGDEPDLCDLVLIAQYHAMIGTDEMQQLPPVPTLPAFDKLGMGDLDISQIREFLDQSRQELQEIEAFLGAI